MFAHNDIFHICFYKIKVLFFKIVIDEEQLTNATDSPFKSVLNGIYEECLNTVGISTKQAQKSSGNGILKWFKYLTTSILPTIPIWSNLLLGKFFIH